MAEIYAFDVVFSWLAAPYRIINAVAVESEMDALLAGLYAGAKTV